MNTQLQLRVTEVYTLNGDRYQCLAIVAINIKPSVLSSLALPADLDLDRGIVLWGSAPTWLYSYLVERCRKAPWVGCYNVHDGAVIVSSQSDKFVPGDTFSLIGKLACPAILIGGPPNSGKSVLSHALDSTLESTGLKNAIHLHRAQWDGEGDWFAEMSNQEMAQLLSQRYGDKPRDTKRFFSRQAEVVSNIRQGMDLALVDFGGMPKPQDVILLHRCTHYIIISSKPQLIPEWHKFCHKQGKLEPVAVIHSVLDERLEILQTEPHLEIVAGPWQRGQTRTVPEVLLQEVLRLLPEKARIHLWR